MSWELGEPLTYQPIGPDSIPLGRATIWPDDMSDWEAIRFAADIEHRGARRMGAVLCARGDHEEVLPCPACGAAL